MCVWEIYGRYVFVQSLGSVRRHLEFHLTIIINQWG